MRPAEISIIGGGWSFKPEWLSRVPGYVIGVNDSAIRAPCHAGLTMDRLWLENRWAALGFAIGRPKGPSAVHVRRSVLRNIAEPWPAWVKPFENDNLSVDFAPGEGTLNGTNSGMCALNLAYQMRPRRLILFGFDMNRSPEGAAYWFPDYEWAPGGATAPGKYRAWAVEMEIAARQFRAAGIEVLNASPTSAIEAFRKVDPVSLL